MSESPAAVRFAERRQKGINRILWIIIGLLCLVILGGGAYLLVTIDDLERQLGRSAGHPSAIFGFDKDDERPPRGVYIPPFLSYPFPSDVPCEVLQGWVPTEEWARIHGEDDNRPIYFRQPHKTAILAPCPGLAFAFYMQVSSRMYEGKPVVEGQGNCIQILNQETGLFAQIALVAEGSISERIPFRESVHTPREDMPDTWYPEFVHDHKTPDDFLDDDLEGSYVKIERGDVIGWVMDGNPYKEGENPCKEICLRLEVFQRSPVTGKKSERYDPFGLYCSADEYAQRLSSLPPRSLWMTNDKGEILHADQDVPNG